MALLYGEGEKAFIRLQEILKEINDMTLFAWQSAPSESQKYRGILARSASEFANAGDIVPSPDHRFNEEFVMTNRGLRLNAVPRKGPTENHILNLKCQLRENPGQNIGIFLIYHGGNGYARDKPYEFAIDKRSKWVVSEADGWRIKSIYISKNITQQFSVSIDAIRHNAIRLRHGFDSIVINALPTSLYDAENMLFLVGGLSSYCAIFYMDSKVLDRTLWIVCARNENSVPWVSFLEPGLWEDIRSSFHHQSSLLKLPEKEMLIAPSEMASISIALEERDENEPVYCVDIHYEEEEEFD
ncbi:hypothetical protein G7Y89_g7288 [Cudoniella acicularis]|uniref:Uncharacterized protein n=1 Tax=Cudoniella acicularis TaxID=354080 RepID=A0A8H4RIR9_9HELO|nr:hypothetical protein G7Y89_g7288 [Cudoniella acicularis]